MEKRRVCQALLCERLPQLEKRWVCQALQCERLQGGEEESVSSLAV